MVYYRVIKVVSILFILFANSLCVFAQEGEDFDFPVEIKSNDGPFSYTSISADSVNKIRGLQSTEKIDYLEPEVDMFKYILDDKIYLAIKRDHDWISGLLSYRSALSFDYELVMLNTNNDKGIIVTSSSILGKGGRYGGYDYSSTTYSLINITTGKRYFLGELYENENHWYEGYTASDTGSEEREMIEMDKEENWKTNSEVLQFQIKVTPGKVRFENIICDNCNAENLDAVSAVEYVWKEDRLIKDKVIPEK